MSIRTVALVVAALALGGLGLFAVLGGEQGGLGDVPSAPGLAGEAEAGESEGGPLSPVGDWLYARSSGPAAVRAAGAYEAALQQAAAVRRATLESAPELAAAPWTHLGPKELGGRVSEIAADGSRPDTVYAATANGGLWKSTDGGLTWRPSWPAGDVQAMGGLAVTSEGIIYAGTGEPTPAGGYVVSSGNGVYRSDDGGATWVSIGLRDSGAIGRIAVDPRDPDVVLAAAAGHLLQPGDRGLYVTADGGETWDLTLPGDNSTTGAIDVAVSSQGRLLAAMWDRDVLERRLAGPGSGLFLSVDGGAGWDEVRLPGVGEDVGRIGVAFAPSDPSRAYAMVANDGRGEGIGLWRSDDGGRTWTRTRAPARALQQATYGWWFGRVFVDPRNEDRVFVAGTRLLESTDGGDTFSAHESGGAPGLPAASQPVLAANQHAMAWDPARPGRVYLGNDGGVYRSNGDGHSGTWVPARSQGWTQHYSVAGSSWTASVQASQQADVEASGDSPGPLTVAVPAPSDPAVIYAASPDGRLFRSGASTGEWTRLEDRDGNDDLPKESDLAAVIAVDPQDADAAFVAFTSRDGAPHVVATTDGGSTWSEIGDGLPEAPVNDLATLPGRHLAAATDVGVFVRDGSSWMTVGSGLPRVPVLEITFHPDASAMTAATFGHGIQRMVLPGSYSGMDADGGS